MVNPGVNHSMMMPNNVEDFLVSNDKELSTYYAGCEKFMKDLFGFLYQACYRFCLRDTQVLYVLNNVREIYKVKEKEERKKAKE